MKKCARGCIFALITAGAMPGCNIRSSDTTEHENRQVQIGLECKGPCSLDVGAEKNKTDDKHSGEMNQ